MPDIRTQSSQSYLPLQRLCNYETPVINLQRAFQTTESVRTFDEQEQRFCWKILREVSSLYERGIQDVPGIFHDYLDAELGPSRGLLIKKSVMMTLLGSVNRYRPYTSYTLRNLDTDINTAIKAYRLLGFTGERKIVIKTVMVDHEPYLMFNNFPIYVHPEHWRSNQFDRLHFAIHNNRIVVKDHGSFISEISLTVNRPIIQVTLGTRPENPLDFEDRILTSVDFNENPWLGNIDNLPQRNPEGYLISDFSNGYCDCVECRMNRYERFFGSMSSRGFRYAQVARELRGSNSVGFMYGPVHKPREITLIRKPAFFNMACKLHNLIPKVLEEAV